MTPRQSASGGLTLWPMNGMRFRPSARSVRLFRSWPCFSSLRYISHNYGPLVHFAAFATSQTTSCCWHAILPYLGAGLFEPGLEGPLVKFTAISRRIHPLIQPDTALWCGSHAVALHWTSSGAQPPFAHLTFLSFTSILTSFFPKISVKCTPLNPLKDVL